jgi:hypothetical protein
MNFVAETYIPSSDFQVSSTILAITADGTQMTLKQAKDTNTPIRKLVLQVVDDFQYNTTYTVVVDGKIKSASGTPIGETKTISFTSEYGPLYATPLEIHGVLKGLYNYFTMHEIYCALRDAGQKVHIQLKYWPDINSPRYRPILEIRAEYFPASRFVVYQASILLLNQLYIKLTENLNLGSSGQLISSESSTTLGDLVVSEKTDPKMLKDVVLKVVQVSIAEVQKELKFWQDNLLNRNKRGYANPISVSFRQGAGTPADRSF